MLFIFAGIFANAVRFFVGGRRENGISVVSWVLGAQKALLRDLDGTLVATEELHLKATMRVLP